VIVRVDYENAYDSVEWEFLEYMMKRLGFVEKWIKWIKSCLNSAVSTLVNRCPIKDFRLTRGLRQGDPLASFLFLIVAESLEGMVREASRTGVLEGVRVGHLGVEVKLLQFVDDMLFFCQPNFQYVLIIKTILRSFELTSGLKVKFHKSQIGAIGISYMDLNIFSNCLNCGRMSFPFDYLGVRIGGNHKMLEFWRPIIHKIQYRLFIWKGKLLSIAGQIYFIKSVVTALPLFYMSFFKVPKQVCKEIRSIQINFLWGWGSEGKKIPWVAWNKVCMPAEEGGLGIRDIQRFNVTLVAKWKWRLGT